MTRAAPTADVAPLAERVRLLQLVRLAIIAAVLLITGLEPRLVHLRVADVAPLTAVYAIVTVAAETARRAAQARWVAVISAMMLVDAVYLAAVLAPVGGPASPLVFLIYLHLIAVTLLASYRVGLKVALWHSLLIMAGFEADRAGLAARLLHIPQRVVPDPQEVILGAVTFLAVALATASFAALSERQLRRGKAELAALVAMGMELEQAQLPEEVAEVLRRRVQETFGFERVTVNGPEAASDAVLAEAVRTHRPVLVRALDPEADAVLASALPEARNVVVIPLVADGEVQGALVLESGARRRMIAKSTVTAVTSFATHAALALRNAWLLAEVERLAKLDGLTGVANRRSFEAALHREVARAERNGQPLSLIVLDVDHFKLVNDRFGHQAGDDVLRHVGRALSGHAREIDLAARYGGEEFCVLLPACPPADALLVANRLRNAIADYADGPSVTASAGIATFPLNAADEQSLVAAADEALYRAKTNGRDRVELSIRRTRRLTLSA